MTDLTMSEQKAGTNLFTQIRKQQVILTASICMIALVIVLKNVLLVPNDILQRDMMMYIIIYFGFLIFAFKTGNTGEISGNDSPLAWDLLVVLITLGIIAVYALW